MQLPRGGSSQDPKGFAAGDRNLYRYVGNSPTNAADPTGLGTISGTFAVARGKNLLIVHVTISGPCITPASAGTYTITISGPIAIAQQGVGPVIVGGNNTPMNDGTFTTILYYQK